MAFCAWKEGILGKSLLMCDCGRSGQYAGAQLAAQVIMMEYESRGSDEEYERVQGDVE